MKYRIEKEKQKAAYLQLYEMLREDIISGTYGEGSRLPSKRQAAAEAGVSVITAEHAYDLLEEEGYIIPKERSGYYVVYGRPTSPVGEKTEKPVSAPWPKGVPEEFSFPSFARTMRQVLTRYGKKIWAASPRGGMWELRQALSSYLARSRGIRVRPSQIIIGSGAEYLYGLVAQTMGSGTRYGLEYPSYEKIENVYRAYGGIIYFLTMGDGGIESWDLAHTDADVLHVTPYSSYPSGVTALASKRREYIDWAEKKDRLIIEDDFASEFTVLTKPEDTLYAMAKPGRVIYMNTFSRTIAPGIRIGYLVLPWKWQRRFEEKTGFYACTVPVYDQLVLAEFIDSGNFERQINRVRRRLREEKKR